MTGSRLALLAAVACALVACTPAGGETTAAPPRAKPQPAAPTPTMAPPVATGPNEAQRAAGEKYYQRDCADCHGASGQGTLAGPPVVGGDSLPFEPPPLAMQRKSHFLTARDVFKFLYGHMPNDAIGTTSERYYWDVLAFVLARNAVDLGGRVLDESNAATIVLHPEKQ